MSASVKEKERKVEEREGDNERDKYTACSEIGQGFS